MLGLCASALCGVLIYIHVPGMKIILLAQPYSITCLQTSPGSLTPAVRIPATLTERADAYSMRWGGAAKDTTAQTILCEDPAYLVRTTLVLTLGHQAAQTSRAF